MSAGELQVGVAAFPLDPPQGLDMDGYADRSGPAAGRLDELMGRVCHLEGDGTRVTLVSLEVLGVSRAWAQRATEAIRAALGDEGRNVLVTATHTHAGPRGFAEYPTDRAAELRYADRILRRTAEAAERAFARLRPARAHVWPFTLAGVGSNRVDPRSHAAGSGLAFELRAVSDGSALGHLLSVGCHSTVLGAPNRAYSGDLFGAASRAVQAAHGAPCLVITGAAADVSTRFVRTTSSYEEATRLGRRLAHAAMSGHPLSGQACESHRFAVATRHVPVPTRALPSTSEAHAAVTAAEHAYAAERARGRSAAHLRTAWTRVLGARARQQQAESRVRAPHVPFELAGVRIGGGVLVTVPAEVPDATYRQWKHAWPERCPWGLATLTNGYEGYFPVTNADSYEALVASFDGRSRDALGDAVHEILHDLDAVS